MYPRGDTVPGLSEQLKHAMQSLPSIGRRVDLDGSQMGRGGILYDQRGEQLCRIIVWTNKIFHNIFFSGLKTIEYGLGAYPDFPNFQIFGQISAFSTILELLFPCL